MNSSDAEVAWSVLQSHGYELAQSIPDADVVLLVTCAIREGAESTVWRQLEFLRGWKNRSKRTRSRLKVGVLGCMAERIGSKIIDRENIGKKIIKVYKYL